MRPKELCLKYVYMKNVHQKCVRLNDVGVTPTTTTTTTTTTTGYLSVEIDDSKDSSRNVMTSDALIFAVDGVVESAVAAANHPKPGADP